MIVNKNSTFISRLIHYEVCMIMWNSTIYDSLRAQKIGYY